MFSDKFLSNFTINWGILPLNEAVIIALDKEVEIYEGKQTNPDIENNLYRKNELFASFAISKAENSQLTFKEAEEVYRIVIGSKKLAEKKKLSQKDHDKLEFFNIVKVFREVNSFIIDIKNIDFNFIKKLHLDLTAGLDIFVDYLPGFDVYRSGKFRNDDNIRVGDYIPAPFTEIESGVQELLSWIKKDLTVKNIGLFHVALYSIHPFSNGNKRVCRILEHILLRSAGINKKNLYSPSYYYHKEKDRYYKFLLSSLAKKNLTYFVSFFEEAIAYSQISVLKTAVEIKREEFIAKFPVTETGKIVLKPLIKQKKVQFKTFSKITKNKIARQTLVDYLQKAVEQKIITKEDSGRTTFYFLNLNLPEETIIKKWINNLHSKLPYLPTEFLNF